MTWTARSQAGFPGLSWIRLNPWASAYIHGQERVCLASLVGSVESPGPHGRFGRSAT